MNRYQAPMPRAAFVLAAVAMTALTFGMSVVVPSKLGSEAGARLPVAAAEATVRPPVEVAISPARIEVIAVREQTTAFQPTHETAPGGKRQS